MQLAGPEPTLEESVSQLMDALGYPPPCSTISKSDTTATTARDDSVTAGEPEDHYNPKNHPKNKPRAVRKSVPVIEDLDAPSSATEEAQLDNPPVPVIPDTPASPDQSPDKTKSDKSLRRELPAEISLSSHACGERASNRRMPVSYEGSFFEEENASQPDERKKLDLDLDQSSEGQAQVGGKGPHKR
jgi:hypothetical protein